MDKCLAMDLKVPGSIPSQGDFFHLNLKEEINQMVNNNKNNNKNNNNSSFSLVFGRWPQTKTILSFTYGCPLVRITWFCPFLLNSSSDELSEQHDDKH